MMNSSWFSFSSSSSLALFIILALLVFDIIPQTALGNYAAAGDELINLYEACSKEFRCGNITGVKYPFWGGDRPSACGHPDLHLGCQVVDDDDDPIATIEIKGVNYRVLSFNDRDHDQTLRLARLDYLNNDGFCSPVLANTTLDTKLFQYAGEYLYITFVYGCPSPDLPTVSSYPNVFLQKMSCSIDGIPLTYGYLWVDSQPRGPGVCNASVFFPIIADLETLMWQGLQNWSERIEGVIEGGFEVKWKVDGTAKCRQCLQSKGVCGYMGGGGLNCYCKDGTSQPSSTTCPTDNAYTNAPKEIPSPPPSVSLVKKVSIGIPTGVTGIIVLFAVICCLRRKGKTLVFRNKETTDVQKLEEFIKNYGSLAPKRYKYSNIKKMTNSFTCKLGQGGFGCVYKGKLSDGRLVAVKLLKESKGNGEEFINEVAAISRTSHVNIVTLLGFCFERRRRALVYEFMPHGSLDKLIFNRGGSSNQNLNLEWTTLYQIAVGVARGLEYLYRGCNTRILHFDIKPHNILLDEDFIPKISDFGLAKLCQRKEGMVSMTHPRGTAGYIAPEVFCRNFGEVSHKSDVYSYGMLVLEMIGGRKNIDAQVSHTSQIYFPTWIYKQLQPADQALTVLHGMITNQEELETARKMILVGLWCIQPRPLDRPSIDKVVEMLERSLQSLEIPPSPFFFPTQNAAQDVEV